MKLTSDQLRIRVNEIMENLFEVEAVALKPETGLFTELELDSLDAIDLIITFEREFKIKPDTSELQNIRTMQDVYNLVDRYYQRLA